MPTFRYIGYQKNTSKVPKLSIISINYNNRPGLESTIKSVVNQDYSDFEYIVIDGGSTDGSKDVVLAYKDSINYWVSERDSGIYHAMNKGIAHATGDYCLFLNSGDFLLSHNILSSACSHFGSDTDILYGDLTIAHGDGTNFVKRYSDNLDFYYVWQQSLPHPSCFIKTRLFREIGMFNEKDRITSDWQFFMQALFLHNASYRHIPFSISLFNTEGVSNSVRNESIINQEKKRFISANPSILINSGFFNDSLSNVKLLQNLSRSKILNFLVKLGFLRYFKKQLDEIKRWAS